MALQASGAVRCRMLRQILLTPSASGRFAPPAAASPFLSGGMGILPSRAAHTHRSARSAVHRRPAAAASADVKTAAKQKVKRKVPEGDEAPWLVVGLGNPGPQYDNTRHNAGFMVIDAIAKEYGVDMRKLQKSASVGRCVIGGQRVLLAKPMTFMNNSGESVGQLAKYYNVPASQVLVIFDDMDTAVAGVKLKQKGGHGGHNGMRSIISHLGNTQAFPRIKVGIGRPQTGIPVVKYVLQRFPRDEEKEMEAAISESTNIVRSIMELGIQKALSGVRV